MGKAATTPARLQYHFANFKGYFCMVCSLRLRHHAFGARHVLHPSSSQFCFQCSCSARQNQRHQRLSFLIYAPQCLTKLKGLVLFQLPTNAVIGSSNAVALQCRQPTAGGSKLGLTQYTAASRTATKLIYVYIQYIYIYTIYINILYIYIYVYIISMSISQCRMSVYFKTDLDST